MDLLTRLKSRLCSLANRAQTGAADVQHDLQVTMDMLVQCLDVPGIDSRSVEDAMECITCALGRDNMSDQHNISGYRSPTVYTGARGRPSFDIPQETLQYFLSISYSIPCIAQLVGVSQRTITRRLQMFGLSARDTFSQLDDDSLDNMVRGILSNFPNSGYRTVKAHLFAQGERFTELRIRESMRRVDPEGVIFRQLCMRFIDRRRYAVKAPNSMWHIDGYHKLIRYFF